MARADDVKCGNATLTILVRSQYSGCGAANAVDPVSPAGSQTVPERV